jgi:alkylation response protein AidB-like acyl-CoA dehydrogenase
MLLELSAAQEEFRQAARAFADEHVRPVAARIDEENRFPRELVRLAGAHGLLAVTIPVEYGGAGRDFVSYVIAIEEVARASATLAVILVVTNSLVADFIHHFGTASHRERWLAGLASGEIIGAFALSEEHAGSDAANQLTSATAAADGGFSLDGRKVWVANAEAADVAIVIAATSLRHGERGMTAFLVPFTSPGIVTSETLDSLGVRGLGCRHIELRRVPVSADALLGDREEGFKAVLWALDGTRVAIAAQALGVGDAALEAALDHARARQAFGKPIGRYQAVQWMLADMATELDAARLLTLKAAARRDRQPRISLEAAMAKLQASEAAHRAADKALQILASAGYRRGSDVERYFRDARAAEIYSGTSEVQRMVIAEQVLGVRAEQ